MSNTGVAAVEKALSLLDCFQPGKESLSLAALCKATDIPLITVYRLMNSLKAHELRRSFRRGRLFARASGALSQQTLRTVVSPVRRR
ncbi:hypothetical protein PCAR4_350124 [Paraburkholderia caribensis]|nr:hypothetical protein PCAR4_350124 [Paraburkholderia caribensis]